MNKHLNIHEHIINSITFPIIIIDDEKIISMVNSSAEDFFKVSSKIILGRSIKDFIPFSSPVISLIENCIETSSSFKEYKIDLSTPMTGDHKDVDVQISMISGLPNKYQLVFLEDYYEKKLLFQNENHKNKLAMSNMSQILAHEVKNPLSGIRGAAQLLEKNLKEKDLEMTNLICKEVDRIRRLIDNLEVFDATSPLDLKYINIHTVLRHVKEIMLNSNDFEFNIIENYEIIEKRNVELPKKFTGVFKCTNPTCISNSNEPIISELLIISQDPPSLKCKYCTRISLTEEIL